MSEHRPHAAAQYSVAHVLNNNAVSVYALGSKTPVVLVGRGIGFGRRAGDIIDPAHAHEHYVAVGAKRARYLELLSSVSPDVLEAIGSALELAEGHLGDLHPSVYLLLTDHLAFAVERQKSGMAIENELLAEISSFFPEEFVAASIILRHLNSRLSLSLPLDEAAYITLHLRAARTGDSVKNPLREANKLAHITEAIISELTPNQTPSDAARMELTDYLVRLAERLVNGKKRTNRAAFSIERDLPIESSCAAHALRRLAQSVDISPKDLAGEQAFFAIFLHGWTHDLTASNHT